MEMFRQTSKQEITKLLKQQNSIKSSLEQKMKAVLKKTTQKIRSHLEEISRLKQKCNTKIKKLLEEKEERLKKIFRNGGIKRRNRVGNA